ESHARVDAPDKVTGATRYPGDIALPGQLWMKTLYAHRAHARIKRLDVARAEQADGVVKVFTARDVPVNEFGLITFDAPVLAGDVVRWIGEKVALVVAETEQQARQALDLIEVEYEDLPALTDPREAMKVGAPVIHPHYANNVLKHVPIRKGDVERGFAESDVIVEGAYYTPMQEHAYLQPEAGLAYLDEEGRVTVQVAGQWTHEDQHQIAHALGLPDERVRVIYPAIGGAFGGREDMSVQIILALAVWRLDQMGIHRPVKTIWSREESILGHHKRHQMWIRAKWGAKRDGRLLAAEVEVIADAGPYAYTSTKVLGNAAVTCTGPYFWPHARVDAYAVVTNNIPAGAFRGFGAPQGHFAAEQQMNKLAKRLGMDPVELRLKNVLREGALTTTQTPLPGGVVTLPQVVQVCARAAGWKATSTERHVADENLPQGSTSTRQPLATGYGFACAFKHIGFSFGFPEGASAAIELHGGTRVERAVLKIAGAEVGQGGHTVFMQMAAEALGLPLAQIELVASDTATSGDFGSASASRSTFFAGNAIRGTAAAALQKWRDEERPAIAMYRYQPPATENFDAATGRARPNIAYGYVAQVVEVEVDTETGQVRLKRVWCADDVGKAINPQLIEGQIEGGVVQALGYAITENFVTRDGHVLTPYFSNYLIPGVLDVPERIESLILEFPDSEGPWGARGMAEMPFIPLAPAITAAVHDATGVWFDELPLTPWKVWERLHERSYTPHS
ncbi:MAG: xanthine dehydrogenase family protein molybdopterin-binding subunit, partial [Chloroflexi bacterium]|nr:xanthine dehydrogenase family protein molybdopterin-binding subunit [Chloroflexota bacterium]